MGDLTDTRAIGPPSEFQPESDASRIAPPGHAGDVAVVGLQEGPYRKTHPDLSCIRLIAASAIVAGLLLGTAPVALAQVGYLIATTPAAFAQQVPGQGPVPGAGAPDAERTSTPRETVDSTEPYRLENQAVTSIFSWKGTSQALKCSYGLLFEGDTRSCQAA